MKTYKAAEGTKFSDAQAKAFGRRIDEIIAQDGGQISPERIVEDAKNPKSVFHNYIDWNDRSAATKYRREQARKILQSVIVVVETPDGQKQHRAFVNVFENGKSDATKTYVTIDRAVNDVEMRAYLLREAVMLAESWSEKYHTLRELSPIHTAIKTTKRKLKKKISF